jgi:HEAT repeat protein
VNEDARPRRRLTCAIVASGYVLPALFLAALLLIKNPRQLYHARLARPGEVRFVGREIELTGHTLALCQLDAWEEVLPLAGRERDEVLFRAIVVKLCGSHRKVPDDAIEVLVRCLRSGDEALRRAALDELKERGDPRTLAALIEAGEKEGEAILVAYNIEIALENGFDYHPIFLPLEGDPMTAASLRKWIEANPAKVPPQMK